MPHEDFFVDRACHDDGDAERGELREEARANCQGPQRFADADAPFIQRHQG